MGQGMGYSMHVGPMIIAQVEAESCLKRQETLNCGQIEVGKLMEISLQYYR